MALTAKVLAAASLEATANTVVYGPNQGKSALISSVFLTNDSGSAITIHIGVRAAAGGTFAYIFPSSVQLGANASLVFSDELTLAFFNGAASGDRLEIWAATSNTVQCVVCGIERDL